jgi:hypothetical protein
LPHLPRRQIRRRRPIAGKAKKQSRIKRQAEHTALGAKYEALTEEADATEFSQ